MSHSKTTQRRQLLVDSQVQGALMWRVPLYWVCFLICVLLLQACWMVMTRQVSSSGQLLQVLWVQNGPALLASIILLPILMLDCVKLSNRFAGPIARVRRHLRQIAAGESAEPIKLRKGNYWQSLADDYNAAFVHQQQAAVECNQPPEKGSPAVPVVNLAASSSPVVTP